MKTIVITGGIASGKSEIRKHISRAWGYEVVDTDFLAKSLMKKGQLAYAKVVDIFGQEVLGSDEEIDSIALGEKVFSDKGILDKLNKAVHIEVYKALVGMIETCKKDLLFIETAVILESKIYKLADELWYIYADKQIRVNRLKKARSMSEKKALLIMKNQLKDEEYMQMADKVFENNVSLPIKEIDEEIRRMKRWNNAIL